MEALDLLAEALERAERTGEQWYEAELHRCRGELLLARPDPITRGPKPASPGRSWLRASKAPGCGSCALRPASPTSGATRADVPRPITCSRRSTAGSPRASTPPTSRMPRRCSTSSVDFRSCEGFRMPAGRDVAGSAEGRRPKAAREGTRGGRARRWGLWGFDGCRRSGAAQGTGLMAARERLVGGAIAAGVAQSAVTRAQAGRWRCDWRSGA
jgi:hypothetical protein